MNKIARQSIFYLGVLFILSLGWFTFLKLVSKPPIDPTSVLIMIWLSILVIMITFFPQLLSKIKRIKIKDIEIDLNDTVDNASIDNLTSLSVIDEFIFTEKGSLNHLLEIIHNSIRYSNKPVLLVVNLNRNDHISIPMFFIYLFFLEMVSKSISVLFFSAKESPHSINEIKRDSIIGVISGKVVIKELYFNFPDLYRIFDCLSNYSISLKEILQSGHYEVVGNDNAFNKIYSTLHQYFNGKKEYLNCSMVNRIFAYDLNKQIIDLTIRTKSYEELKIALEQGDEYILFVENQELKSILPVSRISNEFLLKFVSVSEPS